MSDLTPWQDKEDGPIQRFAGAPNEASREGEPTRWQRFVRWFLPWFARKADMADQLAEQVAKAKADMATAEARAKENEAWKHAEEAREIAARNDQQTIANVKQIIDLAEGKFDDDPLTQQALRLAALNQLDEKLAMNVAKFRAKLADLNERHGTMMEIVTHPAALPAPNDESRSQQQK